jgi:hypothetical protein
LGSGGAGEANQSLVKLYTSFSFKISIALISEILVLRHRPIRNRLNIISLEGICREIPLGAEEIWPVLVSEKTQYGDLGIFACSNARKALRFEERLQLCRISVLRTLTSASSDPRSAQARAKPKRAMLSQRAGALDTAFVSTKNKLSVNNT